jgi:hypothetical protein
MGEAHPTRQDRGLQLFAIVATRDMALKMNAYRCFFCHLAVWRTCQDQDHTLDYTYVPEYLYCN